MYVRCQLIQKRKELCYVIFLSSIVLILASINLLYLVGSQTKQPEVLQLPFVPWDLHLRHDKLPLERLPQALDTPASQVLI